jgi:hypothetical protein
MHQNVREIILRATGGEDLHFEHTIQRLWSGYGSIDRYSLAGCQVNSVVVKHVRLAELTRHPRGWNTDRSHQRKLHSYQVETMWYQHWASRCDMHCRVPQCLALEQKNNEVIMVMEDLNDSGYPARRKQLSQDEMAHCLGWLAYFHARFMGDRPEGLWNAGTYWHLATRPDELQAMQEGELKQAAAIVDKTLTESSFQTLVHGDAKLANFCFSDAGTQVAAVDFQYVGGGCGMKDVAYFISSCLEEEACQLHEQSLLNCYFTHLEQALALYKPDINAAAVEAEWRPLYSVAWTDFYRFLKGWSPGHWKVHGYSEQLAQKVVSQLLGRS